MATEEKPPPKIFCIFHQNCECPCVPQFIDKEVLIRNIKSEINLKVHLNAFELDAEKKDDRNQEIISLENQLNDLKE